MSGEECHYDGWANGQAFCTCGSVFDSVQQFERHAGLTIPAPTPVPSEVAETTAGEREVEALAKVLEPCRSPGALDHAYEPEATLATVAALLDRVRREEGERIAQAIEADVDQMRSTGGGIYTADFAAGAQSTARIARAASVGRGDA